MGLTKNPSILYFKTSLFLTRNPNSYDHFIELSIGIKNLTTDKLGENIQNNPENLNYCVPFKFV